MIAWFLLACSPSVEASAPVVSSEPVERPTEEPVQTEKATVPMQIERHDSADGSRLVLTFPTGGKEVRVRTWGASGLEAPSTERDWAVIEPGQQVVVESPHAGDGDLAVSVAGRWNGVPGEDVRSFTIGERAPTPVPGRTVDGRRVKGWSATPR